MPPWLAAAVGWACVQDPGPAATYVRLSGVEDPQACLALADATLRGECQAFAAWSLVRREGPEAAREACRAMDAGPWRDECFFSLADQIAATGAHGRALCAEAGSFRDYCLAHGMGREAQAVLARSPLGQEAQVFPEVEAIAIEWVGERMGPSRARGIFRKALAARFPSGVRFDPAACGTAPTGLCQEVYVQLVVDAGGQERGWAADGPIHAACAGPVEAGRIEALGLPAWVEGADAFALDSWHRICRRTRAGSEPGPPPASAER